MMSHTGSPLNSSTREAVLAINGADSAPVLVDADAHDAAALAAELSTGNSASLTLPAARSTRGSALTDEHEVLVDAP